MKVIWALPICLFLCGCLPTVQGVAQFSSVYEQEQLKLSCQELLSVGQYRQLLNQIDLDMKKLNQLLKSENLLLVKDQIFSLCARMKKNSELLIQMVDPKYTELSRIQNLHWEIENPRIDPRWGPLEGPWKVVKVEIGEAYTQGKADLLDRADFDIQILADRVSVNFARRSSILDVCQFQQTMRVRVLVTYQNTARTRVSQYQLAMQR